VTDTRKKTRLHSSLSSAFSVPATNAPPPKKARTGHSSSSTAVATLAQPELRRSGYVRVFAISTRTKPVARISEAVFSQRFSLASAGRELYLEDDGTVSLLVDIAGYLPETVTSNQCMTMWLAAVQLLHRLIVAGDDAFLTLATNSVVRVYIAIQICDYHHPQLASLAHRLCALCVAQPRACLLDNMFLFKESNLGHTMPRLLLEALFRAMDEHMVGTQVVDQDVQLAWVQLLALWTDAEKFTNAVFLRTTQQHARLLKKFVKQMQPRDIALVANDYNHPNMCHVLPAPAAAAVKKNWKTPDSA
jgi:hypothetical protein